MKNIIPYGKQKIFTSDFSEVIKALKSNFITNGEYVKKFEKSFSKYTKARYSITCSSGTAAIDLALKSIGLKKNDNIIIPSVMNQVNLIHKLNDSHIIIGNKKLIVKSHENDYRNYKKIFENFNCVIVPKKFTTLPADLIIDNFQTHYLGYYSSIMLHFKRKDISFIIPPDKKLIKISDNEFFGIKHLMKL